MATLITHNLQPLNLMMFPSPLPQVLGQSLIQHCTLSNHGWDMMSLMILLQFYFRMLLLFSLLRMLKPMTAFHHKWQNGPHCNCGPWTSSAHSPLKRQSRCTEQHGQETMWAIMEQLRRNQTSSPLHHYVWKYNTDCVPKPISVKLNRAYLNETLVACTHSLDPDS